MAESDGEAGKVRFCDPGSQTILNDFDNAQQFISDTSPLPVDQHSGELFFVLSIDMNCVEIVANTGSVWRLLVNFRKQTNY